MQTIPLSPVPSQTLNVALANQACRIDVYQKTNGVYVDLYVADALIVRGVVARNLNRIVRSLYLGFAGDLTFIDNQGSSDPEYTGLGTRYTLAYLDVDDLAAREG